MTPTTETRQNLNQNAIDADNARIAELEAIRETCVAANMTADVDAIDTNIANVKRMRDGRIERMKKGDE